MKYLVKLIICLKYVDVFVHKIDCVKVIVSLNKSGHGTVTIGSIEKYITDVAWEKGWVKTYIC